ncbi:MAG TPA: hypothetical protein VMS08_00005, partial [Candidatus Saccharimonadia bacterium]|nr:hypothetical protein [Candidatus Saccharimonadia bacterium]
APAVSGPVSGELLASLPTLFFKTSTPAVLASLVPANLSSGWYKYDLGSVGSCASPGRGPGSFLSYGVFSQIPITGAAFAGVNKFGSALGLEYRGEVVMANLQSAITKANQNLSSSCKINIPASSYDHLTVSYKIWRGWSRDRAEFTIDNTATNASGQIVINTADYNGPATIQVPTSATNADNLFKKVLGAETYLAPTQINHPTPSAGPAAQKALEAERESNLAAYMNGYKAVAVNGFFPTTPPALSVQIADPSTIAPYVVSKNPLTGVGQIQYIPGGSCTGPGITPGKAGTRYLALKLLPSASAQPYCLDTH